MAGGSLPFDFINFGIKIVEFMEEKVSFPQGLSNLLAMKELELLFTSFMLWGVLVPLGFHK